jgi:hypothetical protein
MPRSIYDRESDELKPILDEVLRQRASMPARVTNSNTRAAVLIGVAGALGGTELVTSSGVFLVSAVSLTLYGLAAIAGLLALWPRERSEVDVATVLDEGDTPVEVDQLIVHGNLAAHDSQVKLLRQRSWATTIGFAVLILAWITSGSGTVWDLANPSEPKPTILQIDGDVSVDTK